MLFFRYLHCFTSPLWCQVSANSSPSRSSLSLPSLVVSSCLMFSLYPAPSSLKKNTRTYFYTSFLAYIFGLGMTIWVMHTFKHAQVSEAQTPSSHSWHAVESVTFVDLAATDRLTCLTPSLPSQPALLYLVPACIGFPVVVALLKGELTEMFR